MWNSDEADWKTVFEGQIGNQRVIVEKRIANVSPGEPRMRAFAMDYPSVVRDGSDLTFGLPPEEFATANPHELVNWLKSVGIGESEARDAVRFALDPQETFT